MTRSFTAFAAGLIFGLGLIISGMISPAKVTGFLDFFGAWDASLAFVMVGAITVTAIGYRLAWRQKKPWFAEKFHVPTNRRIDAKLIAGAAVFSIGWGIAGLCPGPGITDTVIAWPQGAIFLAGVIGGVYAKHLLIP